MLVARLQSLVRLCRLHAWVRAVAFAKFKALFCARDGGTVPCTKSYSHDYFSPLPASRVHLLLALGHTVDASPAQHGLRPPSPACTGQAVGTRQAVCTSRHAGFAISQAAIQALQESRYRTSSRGYYDPITAPARGNGDKEQAAGSASSSRGASSSWGSFRGGGASINPEVLEPLEKESRQCRCNHAGDSLAPDGVRAPHVHNVSASTHNRRSES